MDWILSGTTLAGMWLIGNKNNLGNIILAANQVLWAVFAIATDNKGLLPLVAALCFVYLRNWQKWRRYERKTAAQSLR